MTDPREDLQQTLGEGFILERELHGGGMSRVFVAHDNALDRDVVVKVLPSELAASLSADRFTREIKLAAALQEPHIVPVISAGQTAGGLPFYIMPFVRGQALRDRLSGGPVPLEESIGILRDVALALEYAHAKGVVHRDIKPENVLLSGRTAVVTDFGIAKALSASKTDAPGGTLTVVGTSLGTPAYMAPEQAVGDRIDERADIYAWGLVGYELLSGSHPFPGKHTAQQFITAHLSETPRAIADLRKDAPPVLAGLITRCLEKDPSKRPQSAHELVAALDNPAIHSGGQPVRGKTTGSRWKYSATGAAILIVLAVLAWPRLSRLVGTRTSTGGGVVAASDSAGNAVAVIPFANTGGNPQDEYFSDGMTDELAHALSRLPQIRVAGRTSSYAFKGKTVAAQEIGRALNVSAVIEGSVRRAGDRLRVIAQLTSARDGRVMWSDSYESRAKDVFQVQDEFTKAIVSALAPALRGGGAAAVASSSRGTANQDAYDLYLKGRYAFLRRGGESLKRSIQYFQQALEKDPNFARARAGIGMSYSVLPGYAAVNPDSAESLASENAILASRMDSTVGDAFLGLANSMSQHQLFLEAEPYFRRALALQPEDAQTHQWHGDNLGRLGHVEEALAEERRAAELDPMSPIITWEVGNALMQNDRLNEAEVYFRKAIKLDSTLLIAHRYLGYALIFRGTADSAVRVLEPAYAKEPSNPGMASTLLLAYAASGRWKDADRLRKQLEAIRPRRAINDVTIDIVFAGVADAVDELLKSSATSITGSLACDPVFDILKSDPRFVSRVKRTGATMCPVKGPWPIRRPPPEFARKH